MVDALGREVIGKDLIELFNCVVVVDRELKTIREAMTDISELDSLCIIDEIRIFYNAVDGIDQEIPHVVCPLYDPKRYPPKRHPDQHTEQCPCCKGKGWLSRGEFDSLPVPDWKVMSQEWASFQPGKADNTPIPSPQLKQRQIEILQACVVLKVTDAEHRRKGTAILHKIDPVAKIGTYKEHFAELVKLGFLEVVKTTDKYDSGYWITKAGIEKIG